MYLRNNGFHYTVVLSGKEFHNMKKISGLSPLMMIGLFGVSVLSAQGLRERNSVPLKNWDAPMHWQPNATE